MKDDSQINKIILISEESTSTQVSQKETINQIEENKKEKELQ